MKKLQILGTGCAKCNAVVKFVCGILVILGGVYMIFSAG